MICRYRTPEDSSTIRITTVASANVDPGMDAQPRTGPGWMRKKKTEVLPQFQLLREEQEKWELYVLQGTRIRSTMVSSVDELPDFHVNAERTRSSRSHIYVYFAHFSPLCKNNQARLGNAMADSALSPSEETLLITQNSLFERTFKGNMGIQCR